MQDVHKLLKCYANDIKSLPADIHKVIITALDYWLKRAISLADDEDLIFTYRENYTFYTTEARITYRFKYGSVMLETFLNRIFLVINIIILLNL